MEALPINREEPQPLVDQIVQGVMARVENRSLREGVRLPSIRRFAELHGVSRFTVVQAYDRLVAAGYLSSRRGSGFYVTRPASPVVPESAGCDLEQAVDVLWLLERAMKDGRYRHQPGCGWLPADWLDGGSIQRSLRQLSRAPSSQLVAYGRAEGYRPLRQDLQQRLGESGIGAELDQIITTHGVSDALDLIGRYFVRRDDVVLVDDPAYFALFGYLRLLGARVVGVPRNADGPDIAAMAQLLASHQPKLFITSSVLHNPTSSTVSPAVAFQLLQLAERHDFMIVDDDIYGDFQPSADVRLAALDQLKRVIYVSSFSKTISASIRVGYIACRAELARELIDLKLLSRPVTSEIGERLIHQVLSEGHYRKHLNRLRGRLDRAREITLNHLEGCGLRPLIEPEHGIFVWAQLPAGAPNAAELAYRALQQGMALAPGNTFRPDQAASQWLRFNVAYCQQAETFELLARLLE